MPKKNITPLEIGNAKIVLRNFSGKESKYNPAGQRNFCVLLDDPTAIRLKSDSWNVRWFPVKDKGEPPQAFMPVKVSYLKIPPKIVLITSRNQRSIKEDDVNVLDYAEIVKIDLVISGSFWEVNGKTGIKGYLRKAYITLAEDSFEEQYREIPDSSIEPND